MGRELYLFNASVAVLVSSFFDILHTAMQTGGVAFQIFLWGRIKDSDPK